MRIYATPVSPLILLFLAEKTDNVTYVRGIMQDGHYLMHAQYEIAWRMELAELLHQQPILMPGYFLHCLFQC